MRLMPLQFPSQEGVSLCELLARRSYPRGELPGGHEHVRIEGAWTKPSAVYTWELADHLAEGFERAIRQQRGDTVDGAEVFGLESPVLNDVLASHGWKTEKCWRWTRNSHINVVEGHSALALLSCADSKMRDSRFLGVLDSRVAKGALAKGTGSFSRRAASIAGLYPGWGFAPTRLNVADDPTRHARIREKARHSVLSHLSGRDIQVLHASQLKRFAANWVRLTLLLSFLSRVEATSSWTLDFLLGLSPASPWTDQAVTGISETWTWILSLCATCLSWTLQPACLVLASCVWICVVCWV